MLRFFRALFFLLSTAVIADARRVQDVRPINEKQFPSGVPIRGLRVEISHTMNPSHGSNCVLYYRIPTEVSNIVMITFNQVFEWIWRVLQHIHIAYRDDAFDFCFGPDAEISFYSISDRAGQISLSLALPEGQTEFSRRLVGSWRRVPRVSSLSQPLK
jgi:hypothetical protein